LKAFCTQELLLDNHLRWAVSNEVGFASKRRVARKILKLGEQEMVSEIAEKFHWSEDQILRLERLRAGFVAQCPAAADD